MAEQNEFSENEVCIDTVSLRTSPRGEPVRTNLRRELAATGARRRVRAAQVKPSAMQIDLPREPPPRNRLAKRVPVRYAYSTTADLSVALPSGMQSLAFGFLYASKYSKRELAEILTAEQTGEEPHNKLNGGADTVIQIQVKRVSFHR